MSRQKAIAVVTPYCNRSFNVSSFYYRLNSPSGGSYSFCTTGAGCHAKLASLVFERKVTRRRIGLRFYCTSVLIREKATNPSTDLQQRYVDFLIGPETLWPFVYEIQPEVIYRKDGSIAGLWFEDCSLINKQDPLQILNFSVAARRMSDTTASGVFTWDYLVSKGVNPRLAFLASYWCDINESGQLKRASYFDNHCPFNRSTSPEKVQLVQPNNKSITSSGIWSSSSQCETRLQVKKNESGIKQNRFTSTRIYNIDKYIERLLQLQEEIKNESLSAS